MVTFNFVTYIVDDNNWPC